MAEAKQYPDIYSINEIYDTDTNPNGRVIPAVDSLVIDGGVIYYVVSIDPVTQNATLDVSRAKMSSIDTAAIDLDAVSIINYGNSRFYCYYDKSNTPTKITIDNKFFSQGKLARYYRLLKINTSNNSGYDVVSINYSPTGDNLGSYIPMIVSSEDAYIRVCAPCHTNITLADGDIVFIEVYDENKTLLKSGNLYCKPIGSLVFTSSPKVIVGMDLVGTQVLNEDTFYLHPNQSIDVLVLTPQLRYNNGDILNVGVDNTNMFLLGLEGFSAAYPGQETNIILKYFIKDTDTVDPSITENNFIVLEKKIKVISDVTDTYEVKISVIPRYDQATSSYMLFFYLYVIGDNRVYDVTSLVEVISEYDGAYYDGYQTLEFRLNINSVLNVGSDEIHVQSLLLKLNPNTYYEKYIIKDSEGDDFGIYGIEGGIYRRPVIIYNSSTGRYGVPFESFTTKEYFLQQFYYKGRPLYDTSEQTEPTVPTHFTIRNIINNQLLLSAPVAIDDYNNTYTFLESGSFGGQNVIMEFLKLEGSEYITIYGLPVDIITI